MDHFTSASACELACIMCLAGAGAAEPPLGRTDTAPMAAQPVGWLGDGTGVYPEANPPTHWDIKTGENVLWKTRLTGWHLWTRSSWEMTYSLESGNIPCWGNAQPIVVGRKLFVTHDPDWLACLDADTGAVLWRKCISRLAGLTDEQRRTATALQREVDQLNAQAKTLGEEMRRIEQRIADEPGSADLKSQLDARKKERDAATGSAHRIFFGELATYTGLRGMQAKTLQGYAFPTPVSDGRYVYVRFATGAVAAVDLEGKIAWTRAFAWDGGDSGVISPLLVDGKLLICRIGAGGGKKKPPFILTALDAATGSTVWETTGLRRRLATASPVRMRLKPKDGAAAVDVVVVTGGEVLRVADGKVVADDAGSFRWGTPTAHEDTLYFNCVSDKKGRIAAARLTLVAPDKVEVTQLWVTAESQPGAPYNAVIYHDGYLYAYLDAPKGPAPLLVLEAKTGKLLRRSEPIVPQAGERNSVPVYGNPAIAGSHLYLTDQGDGRFAVLEAGPEGKVLGRMRGAGKTTSSPFFHGDRVYVRGHEFIYCVGPKPKAPTQPTP